MFRIFVGLMNKLYSKDPRTPIAKQSRQILVEDLRLDANLGSIYSHLMNWEFWFRNCNFC